MLMLSPQKTIGILGGMGPCASADFVQRILRISAKQYGAVQDNEYPNIVLNSIGLQGFDENGITDMALVEQQLLRGIDTLAQAHVDVIAIPCNTLLFFFDVMQSLSPVPIIHIAQTTAQSVKDTNLATVGLCSSATTVQTKLYARACAMHNVQVITPALEQQETLNVIIESVMAGRNDEEDMLKLKSIILSLQRRGAEGVILGCTELPLVINQKWTDVLLFDSLELLASATVHTAFL